MFYVLIKVYDVENKLFLNKMSIFFTIYKFVLFIGLHFNVIWQMLIFFSVTQFFGFTYKKIQPNRIPNISINRWFGNPISFWEWQHLEDWT